MASITDSLTVAGDSQNIRPFDAHRDMAIVADLIEECFAESLDQDGQRYLRQMRNFARNPGLFRFVPFNAEWAGSPFIGYVWVDGSRIVGNISLIPYRLQRQPRYLIANVAVHPDYRRQGIARNLTLQAMEHASKRGCPIIWLHVREENQGAVNLYQDLGFLERIRRTTWYSQREFPRPDLSREFTITKRESSHWPEQKKWLQSDYPEEVTWYLPYKQHSLAPGISGILIRFFNSLFIRQWALKKNNRLECVVSWQATSTHADALWLAAGPECDGQALETLLLHSRRQLSPRKSLTLDFPAHVHAEAIQSAGFNNHQTLIWMEYAP